MAFNRNVQQAIAAAQMQMRQNPNQFQGNQNVSAWMSAIQNGSQQQGEMIANQIIQGLGISKEQAMQQAMQGLQQKGIIR